MTCNFVNNEIELKQCFDTVSNSNNGSHWCIFDYDGNGNSNILKVGATGENGLVEMLKFFNKEKVQYGFATQKCDSQFKTFLIHWQGENVSPIRLSKISTHVDEIRRFVCLVHLTIYARTVEELELPTIYKKLLELDYSVLNNNKKILLNENNNDTIKSNKNALNDLIQKPIAPTVLSKPANLSSTIRQNIPWAPPIPKPISALPVNLQTEKMNLDERAKFWKEMRTEEENRRRDEILKKQKQQELYEIERKRLEKALHEAHIEKLAETEAAKNLNLENNIIVEKKSASSLIAGRCQIFEQKLAEIESSILKPLTKPKNFKYEVGIVKNNAPIVNASEETNDDNNLIDEKSLSVVKVLQQFNSQQIPMQPVSPVIRTQSNENLYQSIEEISQKLNPEKISVRALWDYQAEDETEISFNPGDIITDVEMIHEGWWKGHLINNDLSGIFPSNYVEKI